MDAQVKTRHYVLIALLLTGCGGSLAGWYDALTFEDVKFMAFMALIFAIAT